MRTLLAALIALPACAAPVSAARTTRASAPPLARPGAELPPPAVRAAMLDALVEAVNRVDGDGLLPRERRGAPWSHTVAQLREEARGARSLYELGRVFRRLDASYPNLHAHVQLAPPLDRERAEGRPTLPFRFRAERIERDTASFRFRLTHVDPSAGVASGGAAPARGDYVEAVDGVPMEAFAREAREFCKWPLAAQCAWDLYDSLRRERLAWQRDRPLTLTLSRDGQSFSWTTHALHAAARAGNAPDAGTAAGSPTPAPRPCDVAPTRYAGFELAYAGRHACVFRSDAHPGVAVLRVRSFRYNGAAGPGPSSLREEVERFWTGYWREHAPATRTLIVDVIENGGGQAPVPWYALFLEAPYQEQYVQFRRVPELDDPRTADALLWSSQGLLHWRDALVRDGTWARTPVGAFLPPVPQFCPDEARDCREGLFAPREHGFRGRVALLLDPLCVSSCAGFAWRMRTALGARARTYGLPDSGDTTFSRIGLAVAPAPDAPAGVAVRSVSLEALEQGAASDAWVVQVASISRTVDAAGAVLSATPQPIDAWVPARWDLSDDGWERAVFEAALADTRE